MSDLDEENADNTMSEEEESSLNESATSVGGPPRLKNKKSSSHSGKNAGKYHSNGVGGGSGNYSGSNVLQHMNGGGSSGGGHKSHRSSHGKPARIRTVLNEKQLHTLRACYNANPRPDALMKEQLVEMTGLHPRVIRVWFQNKRCKDKKKNVLVRQDALPLPNHPHFHPNGIVLPPLNGNSNSNGSIRMPMGHHPSHGIMYDNCY
jgi:hypothetical protein